MTTDRMYRIKPFSSKEPLSTDELQAVRFLLSQILIQRREGRALFFIDPAHAQAIHDFSARLLKEAERQETTIDPLDTLDGHTVAQPEEPKERTFTETEVVNAALRVMHAYGPLSPKGQGAYEAIRWLCLDPSPTPNQADSSSDLTARRPQDPRRVGPVEDVRHPRPGSFHPTTQEYRAMNETKTDSLLFLLTIHRRDVDDQIPIHFVATDGNDAIEQAELYLNSLRKEFASEIQAVSLRQVVYGRFTPMIKAFPVDSTTTVARWKMGLHRTE